MIHNSAKRVVEATENRILRIKISRYKWWHTYYKWFIMPPKIFIFGLGRIISAGVLIKWLAAFAAMLLVGGSVLTPLIDIIALEVLIVLAIPLLMLGMPTIYSLITSQSDSVSLANSEQHIAITIKKLKKTKNLSEEYLDAFKESVQIFEKDANQRVTQLRALISVFFAASGYFLSLVVKNVSGPSDYILLIVVAFCVGLFTAECFAVLKEAVYGTIYTAINEVKFEIKTAKAAETTGKSDDRLLSGNSSEGLIDLTAINPVFLNSLLKSETFNQRILKSNKLLLKNGTN